VIVDHVHLAVVPYLLRWLVKVPYALTCHGIELNDQLSRLRKAAYRGAVLRLANSHFTADRLERLIPENAVETCELGLDDLALPGVEPPEAISLVNVCGERKPLGNQFVLIVARMSANERYKGHDQLIAIMPGLVREIPDAQLVVAGAGDDAERLKALAQATGVGQAIFFTGFASPTLLASLYARCRLFAMPSRGEGFGLVYLEAMRFGKPCIVSPLDAGAEVVVDGKTGIAVDPASLEKLREAIARVLSDDALAARLGAAGLERLNEKYRFAHYRSRVRERLEAVLPQIAAPGPR
jgi:phosphatidylinositol alpha-1,6-mannosyltransferase